ncbi:hypothetical protein SAMD00023353_0701850 [Rosellinia necatrix]|uniref:Uncharacterized protein n=1 Tax=Rosellinia necatrix TaxID=77044 RepID=A0A1S8A5Z9_ROSNE|nr:hypothetical protein SAMD00023353_0701850 [Rosellinia necatrix]
MIELSTEIEFLLQPANRRQNQAIPDHEDAEPRARGHPRGSTAIIAGDEAERELQAQLIVLEEEELGRASRVPSLTGTLAIPRGGGESPEEYINERFMAKDIMAEEPHVPFVRG